MSKIHGCAYAVLVALLLGGVSVGCGDEERTDASVDTAVQACYAQAEAMDAGLNDEAKCACDMCLQELTDCDADEGCKVIRECTQRTGCRGVTDCYLGPALCRAEIDAYGATGLSATLSQQLGDCVTMKGCAAEPPAPACSEAIAFECDGNEDCPGQVCCGRFNGMGYDLATCVDSCDALVADAGPEALASQLCHPDESCPNSGDSCTQTTYLPDFLFRCRDMGTTPAKTGSSAAGEINCGQDVCGSGQKCCVRAPKAPYCADMADACDCDYTPSDAGVGNDAGTDDGGA